MKKIKVKLVELVICVAAIASVGFSLDPGARIYADSVDSARLDTFHTIDNLALIVNNAEDRVAARVKLCQSLSDSPCERMVFYFPQLHFDKQNNTIMLGDKVVATLLRHGMRVTVSKDFHLGYEVVSKTTDTGFDKTKGDYLKVFLEPKINSVDSK